MSGTLSFEARLLQGGNAAVGERLTFVESEAGLLVCNENREAFAKVPRRYFVELRELMATDYVAELKSLKDGIPLIEVASTEMRDEARVDGGEPLQSHNSRAIPSGPIIPPSNSRFTR